MLGSFLRQKLANFIQYSFQFFTSSNLDLVISVDTATAHLAGAMGQPVWLLLPFAPDWRWMLNRDDTDWYLGMRIFRQSRPGDWEGVLDDVLQALKKELTDIDRSPLQKYCL